VLRSARRACPCAACARREALSDPGARRDGSGLCVSAFGGAVHRPQPRPAGNRAPPCRSRRPGGEPAADGRSDAPATPPVACWAPPRWIRPYRVASSAAWPTSQPAAISSVGLVPTEPILRSAARPVPTTARPRLSQPDRGRRGPSARLNAYPVARRASAQLAGRTMPAVDVPAARTLEPAGRANTVEDVIAALRQDARRCPRVTAPGRVARVYRARVGRLVVRLRGDRRAPGPICACRAVGCGRTNPVSRAFEAPALRAWHRCDSVIPARSPY
jgi:hypothetical protein